MDTLLYPPEKKAVDNLWFDRFLKNSFDLLEAYEGDPKQRDTQKKKFLSHEIENPFFDYPKLDISIAIKKKVGLVKLLGELLSTEKNQVVKTAYSQIIGDSLLGLSLLTATFNQDWQSFNKFSLALYGPIKKDIWEYTLNKLHQELNKQTSSTAKRLRRLLPKPTQTDFSKLEPKTRVKNKLKAIIIQQLRILTDLPKQEIFDAEMIKQIAQEDLRLMGAVDWKVVDSDKANISTNQQKQLLKIPPTRQLSYREFNGLIRGHEEFHLERGINGRRSKLKLLGIGLSGYEGAEEGLATIRESVINGFVDDTKWIARFLTIGLILGLDGKSRDFRQTFQIIEAFYRFKKEQGRDSTQSPEEEAYGTIERAMRGTDGQQRGVVNNKDHFYWQNYLLVWQFLEANPTEIYRCLRGKYNPLDPSQLEIMDQLGYTLDKFLPN